MTDQAAETVLRPTPGEGLLARAGDLVLLYEPEPEENAQELLQTLESIARSGGDGRELIGALARLAHGMERPPAFVAYGPADGDHALLVHGTALALVQVGEEEHRYDGAKAVTWIDRVLPDVTAATAALGSGLPTVISTRVRLDNGVVPAGGFTLTHGDAVPVTASDSGTMPLEDPLEPDQEPRARHAAEPVGASPLELVPDPEPAPAQPEPFVAAEPAPEELPSVAAFPDPLPDLYGDPYAEPVQFGGAPDAQPGFAPDPVGLAPAVEPAPPTRDPNNDFGVIPGMDVHATAEPGEAQPSLGMLVLDDGQTFNLDTSYVIGREPEPNQDVVNGYAVPVRIQDPEALVSRAHAMVTLTGWDVQVVDLGSANGTFLFTPGAQDWAQVPAHQPTLITPGSHIAVGGRVFAYEAHGAYETQQAGY